MSNNIHEKSIACVAEIVRMLSEAATAETMNPYSFAWGLEAIGEALQSRLTAEHDAENKPARIVRADVN